MRKISFDYMVEHFDELRGKKIMIERLNDRYDPAKAIGELAEVGGLEKYYPKKDRWFRLVNLKIFNKYPTPYNRKSNHWANIDTWGGDANYFFARDYNIYLSSLDEIKEQQEQRALESVFNKFGLDENASHRISNQLMTTTRRSGKRGGKRNKSRNSRKKRKTLRRNK